ncbi:MAG: hypothetical protein IT309_11445 [Anaerolineales bacterium]|nr:hypothetical protein [Anaerolineales bacterium]
MARNIRKIAESNYPGDQNPVFFNERKGFGLKAQLHASFLVFFDDKGHSRQQVQPLMDGTGYVDPPDFVQ